MIPVVGCGQMEVPTERKNTTTAKPKEKETFEKEEC